MTKYRACAFILASWAALAGAADTGYLLKAGELKSRPFLDAETLAWLPQNAALQIVAREGPWMLVKAEGKQGYVRLLQIRLAASEARLARAPAVQRPEAARSTGVTRTVTTGVRGFDEQGLSVAQPDPAAFALMVSFAASNDRARQFAQRSALAPRTVPYYSEIGRPIEGAGR